MIGLPIYYYGILPDKVPQHFGFDGEPTSYGSKSMIWGLPMAGLFTYGLLALLNRYPHSFNYPIKITEENAFDQYQKATRFMRALNTFFAVLFAYITYIIIQNGLGKPTPLGSYFTLFVLGGTFLLIGIYLYESFKK